MHRFLRARLATAALIACGGCAMSAPADLTPGVDDPSLPGVDAGSDPRPAAGSDGGGAGSSGGNPTDAGPQALTGDSGVVDSAAPAVAPPPPALAKPSAGELLVTEVMYTSFLPEPASEWIELHSLASTERALGGLTIKDGGARTHVIAAGLTIAPGAYVILARNKAAAITAKVPAGAIVYEYGTGLPDNGGIILANGATGGVAILNGATVLANAPYGGWFSQTAGSTVQLKILDAAQSPAKASWCLSLNTWTSGSEKGTPGAGSDCP